MHELTVNVSYYAVHVTENESHLEHLQQCFLTDLQSLKRLLVLHDSSAEELQIAELCARHSSVNDTHTDRYRTSDQMKL